MSFNNHQVADLLDTVADYIDASEGAAYREKVAANLAKIDSIAASYQASTGASFPDSMRNKLASADPMLLDLLVKQSQTAGGSPDSLGGPADETPTQQKTASETDPDARFLNWCAS